MDYQIHNIKTVNSLPFIELVEEGTSPRIESLDDMESWLQHCVTELRQTRELHQVAVYSMTFQNEGSFIAIELPNDSGVGKLVLLKPIVTSSVFDRRT